MNGVFELPTFVFVLLAVFVAYRLFTVLGRKTGNERPVATSRQSGSDNVIPLPRARGGQTPSPAEAGADIEGNSAEDRIKGVAPAGSQLESGLLAIARQDRSFDPKAFLKGAGIACEMIVTAFANGDRRQLRPLTSNEVFDGFANAIAERERRGQTNQTNFIGVHKADIIEAEMEGQTAKITVKFLSQMITTVKDKAGRILEGDPEQMREVTDIWTFARSVSSPDPNWKLVGTQSAN